MDIHKHLIVIDDKDRTIDVSEIRNSSFGYYIKFVNGLKEYPYSLSSVCYYSEPIELEPSLLKIIKKDGKELWNINKILQFDEYIKIFFSKGKAGLYKKNELNLGVVIH